MPRVKRGVAHLKKRKSLHKRVKGFQGGRKNLLKVAKVASIKAGAHAYRDRRVKKRTMRSLWLVRLNAALREQGLSYSKFSGLLKAKGIILNRKVMSDIAKDHPTLFTELVNTTK